MADINEYTYAQPQGNQVLFSDAKLVSSNGVELDLKLLLRMFSQSGGPRGELDANEGVVAIMQEIGKKANVEMYS